MNRFFAAVCLFALMSSVAFAADKAPEIQIIDGKVSIQAEAVPLSRLSSLFDAAAGMTSKVPSELATRTVSVRFKGLDFDAAVRKIFEGQPFDYVVVNGRGIIVTGLAQSTASAATLPNQPVYTPQQTFDQPFENN